MMINRTAGVSFAALTALLVACAPNVASARDTHAKRHVAHARDTGGVRYADHAQRGGPQALVSDGPGSGFGFHHNPGPFRVGAATARNRQVDALHSAVLDDAVGSQPRGYGFYGDSVYGNGNGAAYGVFNGSDSYGSPYFAGYYGAGDGADYGPFGHAYTN